MEPVLADAPQEATGRNTPAGGGFGPAERVLAIAGLVLLGLLLALVFAAYLSPDMLFEFANLLLCS